MYMKNWLLSLLLGFGFITGVSMPVISIAHAPLPVQPPPPKEPPPPPPPCEEGGGGGGDGCDVDDSDDRPKCENTGSGGNVSYRTGYESFIREDLLVNGIYPISMKRQYMSSSSYDSPLGYGWSFNHDLRLFEYPDSSVIVRTGCGVNYKFNLTGNAYQAEVGTDVLTKNAADNSFDLTYLNGARDHFDSQGRLTEAWDRKGNRLEYIYSTDKMPLIGTSPYGVDPARPITVAYAYQLTKIRERLASGSLSGNEVNFTYDPVTGRLQDITSNDGRTVTYQFDDAGPGATKGNLVQVNGLEGVVSTFKYEDIDPGTLQYKDHHNITEVKHTADSEAIILEYDVLPNDRVIKETIGYRQFDFNWLSYPLQTTVTETVRDDQGLNPVTATRVYGYDANGYMKYYYDALGNRTTYTKDANGNATKIVFEENVGTIPLPSYSIAKTNNATFSTNGHKLTANITLDSGETHSYTWAYDQARITEKTAISSAPGSNAVKTEKIFDHGTDGKPTTVQEERRYLDNGVDYLETSYTYNTNGDVLTKTLPDGHVIVNEYGPVYNGRYVTKTYHQVSGVPVTDLEETYQYDLRGNRTHVTDALGHTTITTYDDKNRRETVTNHKGHITTFVYDVNDNLTRIKRDRSTAGDQLDITKLTYDSYNQLTQIDRTDSDGVFVKRSTMRYDSAGNVLARGDAFNNETLLSYDLENRLTRITDAQGNYIKYTLNALGHRLTTEYFKADDTLVRTSSAVFDDLDRQEQIIGAIDQATIFTYDIQGNRITATDALSRPTTIYTYDTLSRLTNIKDANGKDTVYQYDDRDQLRFVTDPVGLVTEYQYNELGQLSKLISPDTGTTDYTYDLAGNRKTQKDARDITVTFGYDELNRITSKTYLDTSLNVTYTYDTCNYGIGKLCSMQDKEGTTTYGYDERGNIKTRSRIATAGGQTYLTQYGYDLNDRLTTVTYPSGRLVTYVRNTLGQVSSVTTTPSGGSQQTIASNLTYLPFGALEDMDWDNGLSLDQSFDTDYRLTGQVLGAAYSRAYGYDDVNNIQSITDNIASGKNQAFSYDDLDRLDDANGTYGVLDYAYDDVGNRTSLIKDAGAATVYNYSLIANQLDSTTGAESHSFAYDDNGNTEAKDGFTFVYDDMNRMSQVSDGAITTIYGFNGKGERVRKTGAVTTLYHYGSSGNLLVESDALGNTTTEYIWLGNQRIAMVQGGNLYFTHTDHLGTVQLLTDTNANVVWSADYKPFGEADNITGSVTYNMRFPGQYYDSESGLHYNYFRDYDPSIGRYIESDSIGLDGGINSYLYANANPLKYYDPNGEVAVSTVVAVVVIAGITYKILKFYNCTKECEPLVDQCMTGNNSPAQICKNDCFWDFVKIRVTRVR